MNIFEFCERYNIKQGKARRMDKDGVLRLDASSNAFDPIRATLANCDPLSAAQLVQLVENPGGLLELGKYAPKAHEQLQALGKPENQAAPREVAANIWEAAKGETEAVEILVAWLKEILPARVVGHNYLAVRLLLGLPENQRASEAPRIPRALLNCRRAESFAGFWHVEPGVSRNVTRYAQKGFDL